MAALLELYGSSRPLNIPAAFAEIDPHMELVLTTTLVFFFLSNGRKCCVTRKGPTTFVCSTLVYSFPDLHMVSSHS